MKKFLITLIVILLVVAAAFGGYYVGHLNYKVEDLQNQLGGKNNNTSSEQNENSNETNTGANSTKIDTSNMVTDLCNDNESLDGVTYKFRLPYININSEGAKSVNEKISTIKKRADESKQSIKNHNNGVDTTSFIGYINYDYEYYVENNILTVIVSHQFTEGDYSLFYYAYNIDITTGKELKIEEIFKLAKQDITQYSSKMEEYSKRYIDPTSLDPRNSEQRGESYISKECFDADKCDFYIRNGNLIALVAVGGTDYVGTYKIDMSTGERVE